MDTKERILAALTGGEPDRVPLTVYHWMLPRGRIERILRERGVGLIMHPQPYRVEYRQVEFVRHEYWQNGTKRIRNEIRTPVGDVWQTVADGPYTNVQPWILEHFIKGPDDYRVMEYVFRDEVYVDNCATIREIQRQLGGDGLVFFHLAQVPIQRMLYYLMGFDRFSYDIHFRLDLFDSLHETIAKRYAELYDFAERAPVELVGLGDNITGEVIGEERYRKYCLPLYARLKDRIASSGKLLAVHMDGKLSPLREAIAESPFDIIEAFTPPPMGDVSIKEARRFWPDKGLWLNFTSSVHLEPPEVIEAHARQLLEEAGSKRNFAIGITEDVPVEAFETSLGVLCRVLQEFQFPV